MCVCVYRQLGGQADSYKARCTKHTNSKKRSRDRDLPWTDNLHKGNDTKENGNLVIIVIVIATVMLISLVKHE